VLIIRGSNCINTASGIVFFFYMFRANSVLIVTRSNFINSASGVVFFVSDRPVCRLRRNWLGSVGTLTVR